MERKRILSRIWQLVKLLIGIGLIIWLLLRVDLHEMWRQLQEGEWIWMLPLLVMFVGSLLLITPVKLQVLVGGRANYSFRSVFDATMVGLFFNNFFPTNIGGDVVKAQVLRKRGPLSWAGIITAILTERATGLLVLAGAFVVYLLARPAWVANQISLSFPDVGGSQVWMVIAVVLVPALLLGWLFRKRIVAFLRQMVEYLASYSTHDLSVAMGWSIAFHGFRLLGLYCFLMFYGEPVALFDLLFVLAIVAFISVLPISIGALGVRENAITWSLGLFGVPLTEAVGLALVNRLLFVMISLIGGVIYVKSQVKIDTRKLL
jgi:uncharacterized membrane protein YbhN (UPF0104 family)